MNQSILILFIALLGLFAAGAGLFMSAESPSEQVRAARPTPEKQADQPDTDWYKTANDADLVAAAQRIACQSGLVIRPCIMHWHVYQSVGQRLHWIGRASSAFRLHQIVFDHSRQ